MSWGYGTLRSLPCQSDLRNQVRTVRCRCGAESAASKIKPHRGGEAKFIAAPLQQIDWFDTESSVRRTSSAGTILIITEKPRGIRANPLIRVVIAWF